MQMEIDQLYYGDYRFIVEFDTGSETGGNQLAVWAASKVDVKMVPLSHFQPDQLLKALVEPYRAHLLTMLAARKSACSQELEDEIADLQQTFVKTTAKGKQKLPGKIQRQIQNLRTQMRQAIEQLEADFKRQELVTLERVCFDQGVLHQESRLFGEESFLRNFYFEETSNHTIRNFCNTFASDAIYRQEVLAEKTFWARRNALFIRNLPGVYNASADDRDYERKARDFFHWIELHTEEILALPGYQLLKEIDSLFLPSACDIDPGIRPAVEMFNLVPDVITRFSCQGVSGKVRFQGKELLVVSPHEEIAYISFSKLGQMAHDTIVALLPEFPSITTSSIPGLVALCSNGDNLCFRAEIVSLAKRLLESVDEHWHNQPEGGEGGRFVAQAISLPQGTIWPGGLLPARLAWLCQTEQIERTLYLLFHINHWAKTREHLLYADRQGLYRVKAALLEQAYTIGALRPTVYIDGSQVFARDYTTDLAAEMAAEVFLDRLSDLFTSEEAVTENDEIDKAARNLFLHIMGYPARTLADVDALDIKQAATAIDECIHSLVLKAQSTRQPIASDDLAALFVEPIDLLDIRMMRNRTWLRWGELDEGDLRKLDPEGLSLIAFRYDSATASHIFHLPLRVAETFLPGPLIDDLKMSPGISRECGIFYGRTITDKESQEYPVVEILQELGVDIPTICPYKLAAKRAYAQQQAYNYPYWEGDDDEDWYDEENVTRIS